MLSQVQLIQQDIEIIKDSLKSLSEIKEGSSIRYERSTGHFYDGHQIARKIRLNPESLWGRAVLKAVVVYQGDTTLDEGVKIIQRFVEGVQKRIEQVLMSSKIDQDRRNGLLEDYKRIIPFGNLARLYLSKLSQESSMNIVIEVIQKVEAFVKSQNVICISKREDDLPSLSRSSSVTLTGSDCGSMDSFG